MKQPVVILLAAGFSRRYQQATGRHKLLEELTGTGMTIFQHSLGNVLRTGLPVCVVLRPGSQELQAFCQRVDVPFLCVESQGMGDSLAAGVQAMGEAGGWIITLADLPYILPQTYDDIAQAVRAGQCARPVYHGQPGHPVGFPASMRTSLIALQGSGGARDLLKTHPPLNIESEDPGCVWDIDLPGDLKI